MVASFFLAILSTTTIVSLINSIIIPVEYVPNPLQCNSRHGFKVAPQCEYNRQYMLIAKVWIGPADGHVNDYYSIDMLVDTGSPKAWVANYNTQVYRRLDNGTITLLSWDDYTRKPTLQYDFQVENKQSSTTWGYMDGDDVDVTKYSNQAMLFREDNTLHN